MVEFALHPCDDDGTLLRRTSTTYALLGATCLILWRRCERHKNAL
jgi:hypothetical protein